MRFVSPSCCALGIIVLSAALSMAAGRREPRFMPLDPPGSTNTRTAAGLVTNIIAAPAVSVPRSNPPVSQRFEPSKPPASAVATNALELRYQKLLDEDDAAQEQVDRWIQENMAFAAQGAAVPQSELNKRIRERLAPVRKGYEEFLRENPNHTRARVAYGSFLGDIGDEDGARAQWEAALQLDAKNPAIYNNLANVYSHSGPVRKAFEFFEKAIELNPREPTYYHNFGTVVYLFRNDAREHFKINEEQVFAKAFELYSNAMRLDPGNFPLASDVAQTYYGITPMRTDEALKAWTNALAIARDQIERDGVYLHFGRIKMMAGRFNEARVHIQAVTNAMYTDLKAKLTRNLNEKEQAAAARK